MGRLFALRGLFKSGRLALRLLRDARVPLWTKAIVGLAVAYVILPLDFIPDWLPVVGQLDDLAALMAGISLFIRLCPPEIVDEHQTHLGHRKRKTIAGQSRSVGR